MIERMHVLYIMSFGWMNEWLYLCMNERRNEDEQGTGQ